jgi:hypothetical protein
MIATFGQCTLSTAEVLAFQTAEITADATGTSIRSNSTRTDEESYRADKRIAKSSTLGRAHSYSHETPEALETDSNTEDFTLGTSKISLEIES